VVGLGTLGATGLVDDVGIARQFRFRGLFNRHECAVSARTMIKHATVQQAHQRQQAGDPYVDVRSIPEFDQGHPAGASNVPLLHLDSHTRQLRPNVEFVSVMRANYPPETPLLVGCQAGVRSIQACEVLAVAGFTNLTNVLGGFAGSWTGDIGWVQADLPVARVAADGLDYVSLHKKTGAR